METERRKFQRFLVQDPAFAVFRPHFTKLGKIKNISGGGAFEYIAYEGQQKDSSGIDIFLSEGSFHLSRIPSKIIYDIKIAEEYQTFSDRIETRGVGCSSGSSPKSRRLSWSFSLKTTQQGRLDGQGMHMKGEGKPIPIRRSFQTDLSRYLSKAFKCAIPPGPTPYGPEAKTAFGLKSWAMSYRP